MELKNVRNLIDKGGVELIKVQLKAAMTSYNILEIIADGRNLLEFNEDEREYGIIKNNLDELNSLPGIVANIDDEYAVLSFDDNASITEWDSDMVKRFEECVFYHMIYERGKIYISHNTPLVRSFVGHLAGLGFAVEDNINYSVIYAN